MSLFTVKHIGLQIDGASLLHDISFTIEQGQHTILLGSNGAGKTLLTQILSGNMSVTEGEVYFENTLLTPESGYEIKQQIGCISPKLFEDFPYDTDVLSVVSSGLFGSIGVFQDPRKANSQVVKSYINRVIAKKHPESRNKALDLLVEFGALDCLDKVFGEVSQGQKIKILLCRCLMTNPRFIILDEPTTALDVKMRGECMHLFSKLAKKTTLLCITHHFEEILPFYTQGIFLKNGTIMQQGDLSKVMTNTILSDLYESNLTVENINQKYILSYSA
jgi:iron complex transport system ATP-binding protein